MAVLAAWLLGGTAWAALVGDVRRALNAGDFARAESLLQERRRAQGVTTEWLEAHSWLGRASLAAKNYEKAATYAAETRRLALEQARTRGVVDADRHLPIALGASIEVQAQLLAARGERDQAVTFLRQELATHGRTSMRDRIQKNLNLLTLEGKPAPEWNGKEHVGQPRPQPVAALKGKPVLLFLWAHWCADCKAMAPIVAQLQREFGPRGLAVVGPTRRYGYVAGGEEANPAQELAYIGQVRQEAYGSVAMAVPVGDAAFQSYGVSTTPTLVLVDRQGIVRLYHPGRLSYDELARRVTPLL